MNVRLFNIGVYLAALVTLLDQATKWQVLSRGLKTGVREAIHPHVNLTLSWNKGITFGLLNKLGDWAPYVLSGIAGLILLLLLGWLRRVDSLVAALGIGLIMGGAVGNVIDRLRFGAVVDFIDVHYAGYHWYVFNLADAAIVSGVGLLLLDNFLSGRQK